MTATVERFAGQPDEWDRVVRRMEGWTHFHLYGWLRVIGRVHGHECIPLVARDAAGVITGVLPLVRVRSRLFGHYLVSMPFVNYGGPLGADDAVHALAQHAVSLGAVGGVDLVELRARRALPVDLAVSHRKITVLLDLPAGGGDALMARLKAKLRSQIRKPFKEGVEVRFGPDQVDPFVDVFARHMRDLGTPVQPRSLFRALAEEFTDDAWFGCAWYRGRPVACGCGFRWADEFEMTWASSLVAFNRLAPNMALYWAFMERASVQGAAVFNFGRCTPGSGTHRFKQQWGGRDEPLYWYQAGTGSRQATPSPDHGAFAWGPRLWRRLPLAVANALGPRIVRGIP